MFGNEATAHIEKVKSYFPETFRLSAFPGETFGISVSASYINGYRSSGNLEVMLYTERLCEDGTWKDFCKGTVDELQRNIVCTREQRNKFKNLNNAGDMVVEDPCFWELEGGY